MLHKSNAYCFFTILVVLCGELDYIGRPLRNQLSPINLSCLSRGYTLSFEATSPDQGYQTEAVVKWFSLTKGFGFVAPADGSADAFLHSSVVNKAGLRDVPEGTKLLVTITGGAKGPQVANIVQTLGMAPIPVSSSVPSGRAAPTGPESEMTGTVKWFKADKGFGFVTPDDGGRDIFVHRSVLLQAGLQFLDSGQKVKMKVQTASKGREATQIDIIG
jgi:CspA family cold shock protein